MSVAIEIKCDSCKNMVGEGPSIDCPYSCVWCAKGHWEGLGPENGLITIDPWEDCADYDN